MKHYSEYIVTKTRSGLKWTLLSKKWWAALPRFGHRQDYWDRVLSMSQEFADKHGKYGYGLALNRVQALDTEWQRLHPAHNTIMEEVFGNGQV